MKGPLARNDTERELVNSWFADGLSIITIRNYLGALRAAQRWCADNGYDLSTLSPVQVVDYAQTIPWTRSSRQRARSALKAFWVAAGREDTPVKALRVPSHPFLQSKALEESLASQLAAHALVRDDHKGLATLLGLYLALRRAEIASLHWRNFDDELAWVTLVGKRDITATLPVHDHLRQALASYRRRNDGDFLFPGRYDSHVTPTTVWGWIRQVGKEAKLGPVAAHVLRHTCLTTINDATGDLRATQVFARHKRAESTAIYTRVNNRRLIAAMQAINYESEAV